MTKKLPHNWYRQLKLLIPTILIAYSSILVAIVGISFWAISTGRRIWYFTSDPFILGNLPFYAGILSTLGILFWSAGAMVCFFSAAVLWKEGFIDRYKRFLYFQVFLLPCFWLTIYFKCIAFFSRITFIFLPFLFIVFMAFLGFGISLFLENKFWRLNI